MPNYTFEEWRSDWRNDGDRLQQSKIAFFDWSASYFPSKYGVGDEAEYRRLRYERAAKWLIEHRENLNFGKIAIAATTKTVVSPQTSLLLWGVFGNLALHIDPPLDDVISMARRIPDLFEPKEI